MPHTFLWQPRVSMTSVSVLSQTQPAYCPPGTITTRAQVWLTRYTLHNSCTIMRSLSHTHTADQTGADKGSRGDDEEDHDVGSHQWHRLPHGLRRWWRLLVVVLAPLLLCPLPLSLGSSVSGSWDHRTYTGGPEPHLRGNWFSYFCESS